MTILSTKALIIGGGPGGYPCAIRLAQLGIKAILVDKGPLGGTCLNVGCIPSKALITAAKLADKARHADQVGLRIPEVSVDLAAVMKWKGEVVSKLVGGVGQLLKAHGVQTLRGQATFVSPHEVVVVTETDTVRIQAENIVIATGSAPIEIPGFKPDARRVIDSTGALELQEVPERLVVVGGGYIGLELGIAYAKLGSKVTVVEALDQILPGFDPEIVRLLDRRLKKLGIEVFVKAKAKGWDDEDHHATVDIEVGSEARRIPADKILVTVGRKPITSGLDLEAAGIETVRPGFIEVDERLQTKIPGIYAIGDVAGQPMLAHKASRQGEVAAEAIAGLETTFDARFIPGVVFTDPEVATAGLMEHEAKAKGIPVKVGRYHFAGLGRALTAAETDGFCKAIMDSGAQTLLGVVIAGPNASDLIAEAVLGLEKGLDFEDMARTIHAHPTLPEALKEAVLAARGQAIHAPPPLVPVGS